ncbi:N-acetylneuraminate synthase family protein [Desulfobacter latus]|uniref:N-acetylneuraminate synthase family protein n=1 Tax=Desulfobacter latus TaxID=2292 RepID=A0A850SXV5_9BACT|nr:N-acetylneuraminate synthase family protein [Desulfobacter latus]NWH04980.1 N-acetylneuraminate synthase family protein [Desulfobacter latus]
MYLIAEIGFNHNGDIHLAVDMIRAAAEAGADAVKFQTFRAKDIALPSSPHYALIEKGEMSFEDHERLRREAKTQGIDFMSTPFSIDAVDLLAKVGVSAFKIASMDCTNTMLLKKVAAAGKPIYLSTGMASMEEISAAVDTLKSANCKNIYVLHCISHYPASADQLNLSIIPYLKEQLDGIVIGYSDHFPGIEACFAAAVIGAQVIETHFTLDKTIPEGDHSHSADPADLKALKSRLALFESMAGSAQAISQRPDQECAKDFRRGVYTRRELKKGDTLKSEDLQFTRPASDFTPDDIDFLEGKIVTEDLPVNAPVTKKILDFG